mmetsp:Transcript_17098/g.42210  ORF Transcript_17098/g.42210 Transcript_17098/m.42210 type:complete len:209 (+) Transcript_17098:233-859(+)
MRKLRLLVKLKLSKRLVVPVRREHRVPARLAVLHISSGRTQYGAFDRPSENFGSTITFRVFFTHHLHRGERARDARVLVVVVPYQLPQPVISDGIQHGLTVRTRKAVQTPQVQPHVLRHHVARACWYRSIGSEDAHRLVHLGQANFHCCTLHLHRVRINLYHLHRSFRRLTPNGRHARLHFVERGEHEGGLFELSLVSRAVQDLHGGG